MNSNLTSRVDGKKLIITRLLHAPRERVFEAWINPAQIIHWWGPDGFTNTILEMDVRPGGVWRFIMHGPDGVDYPNKIVYQTVDRPAHLHYLHSDDVPDGGSQFEVDVRFVDKGETTELQMTMEFATAEALQQVVEQYGALEGAKQTMGRLAEFVEKV